MRKGKKGWSQMANPFCSFGQLACLYNPNHDSQTLHRKGKD